MKLQQRIELLVELGKYLQQNTAAWQTAVQQAGEKNGWFTPDFVQLATNNITSAFLQPEKLAQWAQHYRLDDNIGGKNVGIIMAGNIPLVGFHDFLCVFISGHSQTIKLSAKDDVLLKHLVQQLYSWEVTVQNYISFADMLKGCDAYIATGSGNTARHFEYYFSRFPHIIRQNRTSVAVLDGTETPEQLSLLADDVYQYFGLGCRNITSLRVPTGYNFEPLLRTFDKYNALADHSKYKNNYDYHLALKLMNNQYYMSNASIVLIEDEGLFSAVSQLHYSYYTNKAATIAQLQQDPAMQCLVGNGLVPFGQAQQPVLMDYADGVDTLQFLLAL